VPKVITIIMIISIIKLMQIMIINDACRTVRRKPRREAHLNLLHEHDGSSMISHGHRPLRVPEPFLTDLPAGSITVEGREQA
jgi:hypothetical protein